VREKGGLWREIDEVEGRGDCGLPLQEGLHAHDPVCEDTDAQDSSRTASYYARHGSTFESTLFSRARNHISALASCLRGAWGFAISYRLDGLARRPRALPRSKLES
jgi:hypothetical protein